MEPDNLLLQNFKVFLKSVLGHDARVKALLDNSLESRSHDAQLKVILKAAFKLDLDGNSGPDANQKS